MLPLLGTFHVLVSQQSPWNLKDLNTTYANNVNKTCQSLPTSLHVLIYWLRQELLKLPNTIILGQAAPTVNRYSRRSSKANMIMYEGSNTPHIYSSAPWKCLNAAMIPEQQKKKHNKTNKETKQKKQMQQLKATIIMWSSVPNGHYQLSLTCLFYFNSCSL